MTGQNERLGPVNSSAQWTGAICACLDAINAALPDGVAPNRETAETVRLLADAAAKLTFG